MTYDDALATLSPGHGRIVRMSRLQTGTWIEMRDEDPTGDAARAEEPPPYLFAILSTGDLVRWRPSDEDRNATDWMAA